ncbi:MAG: tetratricopeptide repeat protein [Candidatus Brocadiia bacterium]
MDRKKAILLGAAIVLVTLAFYLPAVDAGFVFHDDRLLTANPLIKSEDGLRRFWFTTEMEDYFPVTATSLWLEWRLWGKDPTGYHVVNMLLHAAGAVLVWRALKRLNVPGAWLAGLIFGVHPVNAASVAWIAQRRNVLALPLCLLSLLLYLRFENSGRARAYAASLALFLLALLSNTALVMLPVVLLLCAGWQRGRVTRKDALRSLPFFALAGALAAVELWVRSHHVLAHAAARPEGFLSRAAAAGWAVGFCLYKAVLPWNLAMVYPRWNVDPRAVTVWLPDLALLAGLALALRYRQSWGRPVLFAAGCFVVSLLPALGFADISFMKYSPVADPRQYVAIVGVVALAAAAGVRAWERLSPTPQKQVVICLVILVGALGALTWQRCGVFKNEATLWSDTLKKNPRCYIAQVNLGKAMLAEAATERDPRFQQGEFQEAILRLQAAEQQDPNEPEAHEGLGDVFFAVAAYGPAAEQYRQALRIVPDDVAIRERLNEAVARQRRSQEAD